MPVKETQITVEKSSENDIHSFELKDHNRNLIARTNNVNIGGMAASITDKVILAGEIEINWKNERWNDDTTVDSESANITVN